MRAALAVPLGLPFLLWVSALAAQPPPDERATDTGAPPWMTAWSPLAPIADHSRQLQRSPERSELLLVDGPRIGLLWTAGNPAALPRGVTQGRGELGFGFAHDAGRYRRPLDEDDSEVIQLTGFGWKPLGRGAAIGRFRFGQENVGRAWFADLVEPYPSNPLVLADSTNPRMRRQEVELEGAFGWRFGSWGLGLAAGVEVGDHRAREARTPRLTRRSARGVAFGILREIPVADIRLAARARWTGSDETVSVLTLVGDVLVWQLEGYAEPVRRVASPPSGFFRRLEGDAWAWGFAAAGSLAGADWTLAWERTTRDESQFSEPIGEPSRDRWEASGWVLGGAIQRPVLADGLRLTARARYSRLDGDARRFDLEGVIFRAAEKIFQGSADLRYEPPGSPWSLAAAFTLRRESRVRRDFIAEVRSEIESWTPGGTVELARRFGSGTAVAAGFGLASYSASALLPNPEMMGPVYGLLVAPELALYATQARPTAFSFSLRQRLKTGMGLLLRARRESAGPSGGAPPTFAPVGDRTLWNVSLTLILSG